MVCASAAAASAGAATSAPGPGSPLPLCDAATIAVRGAGGGSVPAPAARPEHRGRRRVCVQPPPARGRVRATHVGVARRVGASAGLGLRRSHLPDITVITPVFIHGSLTFWVASRGAPLPSALIPPTSAPGLGRLARLALAFDALLVGWHALAVSHAARSGLARGLALRRSRAWRCVGESTRRCSAVLGGAREHRFLRRAPRGHRRHLARLDAAVLEVPRRGRRCHHLTAVRSTPSEYLEAAPVEYPHRDGPGEYPTGTLGQQSIAAGDAPAVLPAVLLRSPWAVR